MFNEIPVAAPGVPIIDASILAAASADARPIDQATAAPGAAPLAPPAPIDYAKDSADLVEFCWTMFSPLYPSLSTVYTDDVRTRIAGAMAPVLQKYGFSMADFFGKWAPEIGLTITVAPLIAPTIAAIRADKVARDAAGQKSDNPLTANDAQPIPPVEKPADSPLAAFPGLNAKPADKKPAPRRKMG